MPFLCPFGIAACPPVQSVASSAARRGAKAVWPGDGVGPPACVVTRAGPAVGFQLSSPGRIEVRPVGPVLGGCCGSGLFMAFTRRSRAGRYEEAGGVDGVGGGALAAAVFVMGWWGGSGGLSRVGREERGILFWGCTARGSHTLGRGWVAFALPCVGLPVGPSGRGLQVWGELPPPVSFLFAAEAFRRPFSRVLV